MADDLVDVPTEKLMEEVQRRLNCQSKPQKRVILVGGPCMLTDAPLLV